MRVAKEAFDTHSASCPPASPWAAPASPQISSIVHEPGLHGRSGIKAAKDWKTFQAGLHSRDAGADARLQLGLIQHGG